MPLHVLHRMRTHPTDTCAGCHAQWALQIRTGIMLLGPAACGKSSVVSVLAMALSEMDAKQDPALQPVSCVTIFPKVRCCCAEGGHRARWRPSGLWLTMRLLRHPMRLLRHPTVAEVAPVCDWDSVTRIGSQNGRHAPPKASEPGGAVYALNKHAAYKG